MEPVQISVLLRQSSNSEQKVDLDVPGSGQSFANDHLRTFGKDLPISIAEMNARFPCSSLIYTQNHQLPLRRFKRDRKDAVISQKTFGTACAAHCSPVNLISVYRVVVTRIGFNVEQLEATEKASRAPGRMFTTRQDQSSGAEARIGLAADNCPPWSLRFSVRIHKVKAGYINQEKENAAHKIQHANGLDQHQYGDRISIVEVVVIPDPKMEEPQTLTALPV
ncbi:hypothetical protein U0070_014108 [Myodes glareolus]|uniref:Uncharacterized protein n=1 Tax=Myodes glareolus TaxID=447135 RepID=A0AAW0JE31_MYOGA